MQGYYQTADSPMVAVSGPRLLSMPYQLMTSSFTIASGGRSTVHGVPVKLLLLKDSEGAPMKIFVDLQSRRIVRDSGVFTIAGAETELSSEFHDFRKVDGMLFPFRIVNYAGRQRIGELRIREYCVNPQLSDTLFTPDATTGR
jgi:hypothetical protein